MFRSKVELLLVILSIVMLATSLFGQDDPDSNPDISKMKDEELLINLSSANDTESTKSAIEIFKRGQKMFPLLLKLKGNKSLSHAYCLGDPLAAMGTLGPGADATPAEIEADIKAGRFVTVEVVSLYLISAIYYDNLAFAQVRYLTESKRVKEKKYNTPDRIKKAWKATEKWYKKVETDGLLKLRDRKEFPLKSTEVHFYGTEPNRKRNMSDCGQ